MTDIKLLLLHKQCWKRFSIVQKSDEPFIELLIPGRITLTH